MKSPLFTEMLVMLTAAALGLVMETGSGALDAPGRTLPNEISRGSHFRPPLMPRPASAADSALTPELSVTVSVAVLLPNPVGVKVTVTAHPVVRVAPTQFAS